MTDGNAEFAPKPLKPSNEVAAEPKVPLGWRIARATGVASLLASIGIATTGNADNVVNFAGSVASDVANVGLSDAESRNNERVREDLKAQGKKFGDYRETAMAIDPQTEKEGIVFNHGSLGEITHHGVPGVGSVGIQEPIVHLEASTEGETISYEKLKELGIVFGDIWMAEVVGGPYDGKTGPGDWVKFTVGEGEQQRTFFAAQKFATYDGKKELRINEPGQK